MSGTWYPSGRSKDPRYPGEVVTVKTKEEKGNSAKKSVVIIFVA